MPPTTARGFNFEMELISPKQAQDRFPYITLDGIAGAAWVPSDGYVDPSSVTQALAKGARAGGVKILQDTRVTGFQLKDRRIAQVLTDKGAHQLRDRGHRGRHLVARGRATSWACAFRLQRSSTSTWSPSR